MRKDIFDTAKKVFDLAILNKVVIASAESCTGGMLSSTITEIPGSSAIFDCGFITYSNIAKMKLLSVNETSLNYYGAVSEEVGGEMAI